MKRPKKKGNFSPLAVPILLMVILFLSVVLAYFYHRTNVLTSLVTQWEEGKTIKMLTLSQEKDKDAEELQRCYEGSASFETPTITKYTFNALGLYHPDFIDRNVTVEPILFRGHTIERKIIHGTINPDIVVIVYQFTPGKYADSLQRLDGFPEEQQHYDFPIFDGYENRGEPIWISERMRLWKGTQTLKTKQGITMHTSYNYGPKSIIGVNVEFYIPQDPYHLPSFVILRNMDLLNDPLKEVNDAALASSQKSLRQFAEALSLDRPEE